MRHKLSQLTYFFPSTLLAKTQTIIQSEQGNVVIRPRQTLSTLM